MEYAKLNNKILKILKPVKNRAQIAAAMMLFKQSENVSSAKETIYTEKVVSEKSKSLRLWMSPYLSSIVSGASKQSVLNSQGGEPRLEPEEMLPGTVYQGEVLLIMNHDIDEDYSLFIALGAVEVQISIAGTSTGMSDQYRLFFNIHFSHGDADARKFYFTGYFEDKDPDGKIIQIPVSAVQQEIDTTSYKTLDILYQGASVTTSCQIRNFTLHKYEALPPSVGS
jgi:hypothetical protein